VKRGAIVLVALASLAGGCALLAEEPPEAAPRATVPELVDVSADVSEAERVRLPRLARDSAERRARRLTVRVRNLTCEGVVTGSGFALGDDLLVTNRHVLAGAEELEVSTWDGKAFRVASARVGALGDVGLVSVEESLPLAGELGRPPEAGDLVTVVGYPRGGPLTLAEGAVVDRIDGAALGIPGSVVRLSAHVEPGNSGGPVLNGRGQIAGIVYARQRGTGFGLAIPVDTFRRLARVGGYENVPPCGAE
jgi:S1-C subfamily serine protease